MYSIFSASSRKHEFCYPARVVICYQFNVRVCALDFLRCLFGLWNIAVSHYRKLLSVISHLHNLPRIITASLLRFKFIQKSLLDGTLSSIFLRSSWQNKSGNSTKTERTKINFPKLQDVLDEMGLRYAWTYV